MAIALRAASSQIAGSRTNSACTVPAGTALNDIVLYCLDIEDDKAVTAPSGFSLALNIDHPGQPVDLWVWWKRAGAGESGSYATAHSAPSVWTQSWCGSFSGCLATGSPFAATSTGNTGTSTAPTATGLTPDSDGAMLIYAVASYQDQGLRSPPTGWSEQYDTTNNLYIATLLQATAAATGNISSASNSVDWMAALLALKDAAAGGATDPFPAAYQQHPRAYLRY